MDNGIVIRPARFSDMEAILGIAKEFHDYAELEGWGLGFDRDLFADVLASLMTFPGSCVMVADVGGMVVGTIAGTAIPWFMDRGQVNATENWWFVKPDYRGKAGMELLDAFEDWARSKGARVINVAGFYEKRIAALERLYRRKGYKPLEIHFVKEL